MRNLLLFVSLSLASPAWADEVRLRPDAPERHVVVKGDTLWDISAKFLSDPWKWPDVWRLNKDHIRNPHLIYPGDVVALTLEDGQPRLSLESGRFGATVRLSPSIRGEPIESREKGIPAFPPEVIGPFMSQARIVDPDSLKSAPRLLGAEDERVMMMQSDVVYATAGDPKVSEWHIIRPGNRMVDPDSKEPLGFEALHVGDARTIVAGNPQTLVITRGHLEILRGDKLVPAEQADLQGIVPRAPEVPIEGKIISAYGGLAATGRYATVMINKGRRDGIENGHVLAIHHKGREVKDEPVLQRFRYMDTECLKPGETLAFDAFHDPKQKFEPCNTEPELPMFKITEAWRFMDIGCLKPGAKISAFEFFNPKEVYKGHCRPEDGIIKLPDARVGLAMVYQTHDKVAYAVVMQSSGPVYLMDMVRNP
jgi:hypothetical protein